MAETFPFINKIIFKKYRTINKLGDGAFLIIFSAENIINKKQAALKIQDKKNTLIK